jgi:hypothetical protein
MHAVAEPLADPNLKWFKTWTAKIDLTLNVSTLDQLNPTVVFNNPLHNAYPNVGTSSLPGTSLAAFQQKFTFGLGGGVSDQRSRAEDYSFTLSLLGLRTDLTALSKTDIRFAQCLNPATSLEGSNLDMKSWIDGRVMPLVVRIDGYQVLTEGYHQQAALTAKTPPVIAPHGGFDASEVQQAQAAADQASARMGISCSA